MSHTHEWACCRNFPFSMVTRKTAPAIAAGCTVRLCPYSAILLLLHVCTQLLQKLLIAIGSSGRPADSVATAYLARHGKLHLSSCCTAGKGFTAGAGGAQAG